MVLGMLLVLVPILVLVLLLVLLLCNIVTGTVANIVSNLHLLLLLPVNLRPLLTLLAEGVANLTSYWLNNHR